MAKSTLPTALQLVFGDEGGYVDARTDRGGPTKYGITHRTLAAHRGVTSVTAAQVKALTLKEAQAIYRKSYWPQAGGDLLPAGLDYAVFDFAVNSGPARAVKALQKLVGVRLDGIVGMQTVSAARKYPGGVVALIEAYCAERMRYLRSLGGAKGFPANGRGWTIRVTGRDPKGQWAPRPGVIGNALRLAGAAPASAPDEAPASPPPLEVGAKADPQDTGITEIAKNPEAWGPIGGLLSALGALTAGTGPVQWALAVAMLALTVVGLVYLSRRIREA